MFFNTNESVPFCALLRAFLLLLPHPKDAAELFFYIIIWILVPQCYCRVLGNIMSIMLRLLYQQPQSFDLFAVFCAAAHNIDARSIDVAVTENICQFRNIFFNGIKMSLRKVFANCAEIPCFS